MKGPCINLEVCMLISFLLTASCKLESPNEVDTTFLELNRNITDTITCMFEKSEDNSIIRKVWYIGNVKWDDYSVSREFTIMK